MPIAPIITGIHALPTSPFEGTGNVGIVITSGIPSFFRIIGANLHLITSIRWYPKNPASLIFEMRELILVDDTLGTFMVRVTDNLLDTTDRAGRLSISWSDGSFGFPVITYGPVSVGPLWQAPGSGLNTG
jgi:hypothetical protein